MSRRSGRSRPVVAAIAVAVLTLAGCHGGASGTGIPAGSPSSGASTAPSSGSTAAAASPTPTHTAHPQQASTLPDATAATAALATLTAGRQTTVVRTPSGYQAAAFDQVGHVSFWLFSAAWRQVGASTYPYGSAAVGLQPHVTGLGTVLSGMSSATFILDGTFSGDGSGNSLAYTAGPSGWGAIKAENDGNLISSGQGVTFGGLGLESGFYFVNGELETADCSATLPIADCGGSMRVLKYWKWNGHDFSLASRAGLAK